MKCVDTYILKSERDVRDYLGHSPGPDRYDIKCNHINYIF